MYAVIKTGGKQYNVTTGDVVKLEKIAGEEGKEVVFKVKVNEIKTKEKSEQCLSSLLLNKGEGWICLSITILNEIQNWFKLDNLLI